MFDQLLSAVTTHPIRYGAPLVAGAFLLFTYYRARNARRGPSVEFWERIRQAFLPALDYVARKLDVGYAAYQLGAREYAGTLQVEPEEAEKILHENGFRRNPLAAFKTLPDGRKSVGSWSYRESLLSKRQIHVMLFDREGQGTDVYAHEEYSSLNPLVALKHYRGVGYAPQEGQQKVHELLPQKVWMDTSDPNATPDGEPPIDGDSGGDSGSEGGSSTK